MDGSAPCPAGGPRHAVTKMKKGLITGLRHQQTYVTTPQMRAKQLATDVLSTPALIGLMEGTCVEVLVPYLDHNEQSVGFHVDVRHVAPTRIGRSVTVTVELTALESKKLRFAVSAFNDQGIKIGEGTHRRALIEVDRFAGG
jgi:fluoroacetyl-CoA thioesterase